MSPTPIHLKKLPIELTQFLKYCGLAESGGQAKIVITEGNVFVNDEIETKKSRKLALGDRIKIENREFIIVNS